MTDSQKVLELLVDIINDADDTGCDGTYVVSADCIEKALEYLRSIGIRR